MEVQTTIHFEPIAHRYYDDNNNTYTSVTQLIHKVQKPFDHRYWAMYTALKDSGYSVRPTEIGKIITVNTLKKDINELYRNPYRGVKVDSTVKLWKDKTDASIIRGNNEHDFLETSINKSKDDEGGYTNNVISPNIRFVTINTKHDLDKTDLEEVHPVIYIRLLEYIKKGCTLFAEKKIYTTKYCIAGTIDVLIIKGKYFAILDWKTNKDEMMFHSGYFKKIKINDKWIRGSEYIKTDDRLLKPLNHLQDCKGIIYSLQLSLYAYIMELWGFKLVENGLEIFHLRPALEPKLLKIEYLKQDIHNLLEYHINNDFDNKKINTNFGIQ